MIKDAQSQGDLIAALHLESFFNSGRLPVSAQGLSIKTVMAKAGSIENDNTATSRAAANLAVRRTIFTGALCGRDRGRVASVNVATLMFPGYDSSLPHNDRRSNPFKSLPVGK